MRSAQNGGSFEYVRINLIEHMADKRRRDAPTGNHAAFRLAKHNPTRYVDNATGALGELMKLGYLEKTSLPSTGPAAAAYNHRTFDLTPSGQSGLS